MKIIQCTDDILVIMNSDSGIVNTDSGKPEKVFMITPESVFTINQNRCSRSSRISVHDGPEYALARND